MLGDDIEAQRLAGAGPRVEAYRAVVETSNVTELVAMCAICKTQLGFALAANGLPRESVVSLHQVLGDALVV